MSVKVSSWVWHNSPKTFSGNELLVMVALADVADDDGRCVYFKDVEAGTQEALAEKTRMSVATFRRATQSLQAKGLLSIERRSQHAVNEYRINVTAQIERSPVSGQTAQIDTSDRSTVSDQGNVKRKNVSKREAVPFPAAFRLTDSMREWARVNAPVVNVDRETDAFVDYWVEGNGKGKQHKNWEQTWRNWFRNAQTRAERFGWTAEEPGAEVVELENVTQRRIARELAEQKARWLAERGITEEEYEANRDNPAWLASLEKRHG